MNQDFFSINLAHFIEKESVSGKRIAKDLENICLYGIHKYSVFLQIYQVTSVIAAIIAINWGIWNDIQS